MSKHKKAQAKPVGGIALAAKWPVHEVLLSRDWDEEAALITILVARRSPITNKVAAGLFLVDLACLGIKSAQAVLSAGPAEYSAGLRAHALRLQPMAPADFNIRLCYTDCIRIPTNAEVPHAKNHLQRPGI